MIVFGLNAFITLFVWWNLRLDTSGNRCVNFILHWLVFYMILVFQIMGIWWAFWLFSCKKLTHFTVFSWSVVKLCNRLWIIGSKINRYFNWCMHLHHCAVWPILELWCVSRSSLHIFTLNLLIKHLCML